MKTLKQKNTRTKPVDDQNELFIVVDQDDNIIGYKTRQECHADKFLIHRAVGVIIYNNYNEILLQKRSARKDTNPGKYTLSASGHVSKGESYAQTAIREMKEELGIQSPLSFVTKYHHIDSFEQEMIALYKTVYNGSFKPNEEVERVVFMKPEEILVIQDKLTPCGKDDLKQLGIL